MGTGFQPSAKLRFEPTPVSHFLLGVCDGVPECKHPAALPQSTLRVLPLGAIYLALMPAGILHVIEHMDMAPSPKTSILCKTLVFGDLRPSLVVLVVVLGGGGVHSSSKSTCTQLGWGG